MSSSLLAFLLLTTSCYGANLNELSTYMSKEKYVADAILSRDFHRDVRPPGRPNAEDPVDISVSLYVMELGLCSKHQQLVLGGYFRQSWNDPRLAYDFGEDSNGSKTTLFFRDMFEDRKIWVPDTFLPGDTEGFLNDVQASTGGRSFSKVQCCGGVLASMKIRTKHICPVDNKLAVGEEVTCTVSFESWWVRRVSRTMPGPLGLPIDTYNFSKDDLRDKERFFSQACHEEENLNFYAVSFFRDLSPSNPDFHSVDHLRYAWKDDGLKISDEAKTLLRNKGWELVDARPENGKISIPVEGKTKTYSNAKLILSLRKVPA